MIRRLRLKFIGITMVIVMAMLTILLVSQFNFTHSSLAQINRKALEEAARAYTEQPAFQELPGPGPQRGEKPRFEKPGAAHPVFVLTMDAGGSLTAAGSSYYDLADQTALQEIYLRAAEREKADGVLWDYALRYLRADSPGRTLYFFTDISGELETMKEVAKNSIMIWHLGLFGFLILSIFLANWAIRPVEQAWQQQRQFVADASHELKTPLTVILTNAELLRELSENDRQRQFSESIVTMAGQMRGLVTDLLQLARADSGQTDAERTAVDLSALLEQTLLPFEPLYFEAGLILDSRIQPGVTLTGSESQLRQVAEILLDNALKYTAPGGTVRLGMEVRGHQCSLRISGPGAALTARQCRDIFKRFYRVDPARSRSGSYGLGLAIAARIVADHRGRIWAESRDGINTFYVNLPVN